MSISERLVSPSEESPLSSGSSLSEIINPVFCSDSVSDSSDSLSVSETIKPV
ncbi:MAG: hypothetical protein SPL02_00665 [Bacilli bacterium]|nr:hypothetical protein [Bacilli bacterium]MDY6430362.1 hypothetical protein [Bacilli bacterium]